MMRRRRVPSLLDEKENLAWPIPIWRPRSNPPVPVHKRVLSLLSPRPRLREGEGVSVPLRPAQLAALRLKPPFRQIGPKTSAKDGKGNRGGQGWSGYSFGGGGASDGCVEAVEENDEHAEGRSGASCDTSQTAYAVATPKITVTPTLDSPRTSRGPFLEDEVIRRPRSHDSLQPTPQVAAHPGRVLVLTGPEYRATKWPSTPRSAPSTRTRFPSDSSHTPSVTPTLHVPLEPASGRPRRSRPPPGQATAQKSDAHRARLLHLLRLTHSLNLARQLLYAYNRVALLSLSTTPFPNDVRRDWENRLDEWWAQTSGVLSIAHARVRVELRQTEGDWMRLVEEAGGHVGKEMKRLKVMWNEEDKPVWDETGLRTKLSVGQVRRASAVAARREKLEQLVKRTGYRRTDRTEGRATRVPGWVIEVVPEPFGADEVEEEVWMLEAQGRVPTGTFSRLRARGLVLGHDGASERLSVEHGCDFGLNTREQVVAAEMGLRTMDIDEKHKAERAAWRPKGGYRWSSFL